MCKAPDCNREAKTKLGFCIMHYKRYMRNGTLDRVIAKHDPDAVCVGCGDRGKMRKGYCNACRTRLSRKGYLARDKAVNGSGTVTKAGYMLVTHNSRREYLHRINAEQMLGRPLLPGEVVHHNDGDGLNNDPSNLTVFNSQSDHMKHHRLGDE